MSLAYHRLKVAQDRFQQSFATLDAAQQAQIENLAQRSWHLETRVLRHSAVFPMDETALAVDVATALATIRQRYEDPTTFAADLALQSLTATDLQTALERELRFNQIMQQIGDRAAAVSETEVAGYFDQHQHQWQRPEQRAARHILITVNDQYPENQREAAKTRLMAIRKRLLARPTQFSEEAARHSECPTALQGGDLGWVTAAALYPELGTALFAATVNTLLGPIASPLGWHLIQYTDVMPAHCATLAELRPAIERHLSEAKRRQQQKQWLAQLPEVALTA